MKLWAFSGLADLLKALIKAGRRNVVVSRRRFLGSLVLDVVFVAMTCFLSVRVVDLGRKLRLLEGVVTKPPVGARMPSLTGYELDGQALTIAFEAEERPILLMSGMRGCPFCEENWSNWQALMDSGYWRPILVDVFTGMDKSYLSEHGVENLQTIRIDADTRFIFRLRYSPTTVLISPGGTVMHSVTGVLKENDLSTFLKFGGESSYT